MPQGRSAKGKCPACTGGRTRQAKIDGKTTHWCLECGWAWGGRKPRAKHK